MQLTVLQMVSTPDLNANLTMIESQLAALPNAKRLVALPECALLFGGEEGLNTQHQEMLGCGPLQTALADIAKRHQVWLLAGTIPVKFNDDDRYSGACLLFTPQGQCHAHYEKMHLFDVQVDDNTGSYRESDSTRPGKNIVVCEMEGIKLGFSVCYDLRFPGLYTQLAQRGAQIIVVPSAFTQRTGAAHWEPLLRARAIENQVYIVAPNQGGIHQNGRETYGHSMIINPWGEIEVELTEGVDCGSCEFDAAMLQKITAQMPVKQHNRFKSELIK